MRSDPETSDDSDATGGAPAAARSRRFGLIAPGLAATAVVIGLFVIARPPSMTDPPTPSRAPSVTPPPSRDARRVQAAHELLSTDPITAAVLLREVQDPHAADGWSDAALRVLKRPLCPEGSRPCDAGETTPPETIAMPGPVRALAALPHGSLAVVGTPEGVARLEAHGASVTPEQTDAPRPSQAVALTPDGRWAATSDATGSVRLWQLDGDQHHVADGALEHVWALGLSPTADHLAVGDGNGEIMVWSRHEAGLVPRATPSTAGVMVRVIEWIDGAMIVGDQEGRLLRWTSLDAEPQVVETELGAIAQIVPASEPGRFATLHIGGTVGSWRPDPEGRPTLDRRLQCTDDLLLVIADTDDGLVGVARHGSVVGWPPSELHCRRRAWLPVSSTIVRAAILDDGDTVLTAEADQAAVQRFTVGAYEIESLHARLRAATPGQCLTLAQRMELLADDEDTARDDLRRCQQREGLRP